MDTSVIIDLIDKKIALLTTIANTSMLWWVSATVLCATLLAGIWRHKELLSNVPSRGLIGGVLYFFFSSIVLYGILVTVMTAFELRDVRLLLGQLGARENLFDPEFLWILLGMPVGTSSFVLFLFVWHVFWRALGRAPANRSHSNGNAVRGHPPLRKELFT
jgi:hypothetical protein